jgi:hypothetical protein
MSTLPLSGPKFRALDANGNPLSGGKLYSYAAGTSDPLNTYTTRAGNIANANPVVLDANGEADVWTSIGVLYKFELKDSSAVIQWTVDNFPSGEQVASTTSDLASTMDPGLRLTLTSGTPVTSIDVSGASSIFYTPHKHNKLPLYDGTDWALHSVATELSQALSDNTKSPAAAVASSVYDVFAWSDAGTLRLSRGPPWTSVAARGTGAGTTELERKDGRYVNKHSVSNGPAAQRGLYVGSVYTESDALLHDMLTRRHCWNAYNRVERPLCVNEVSSTASWTYSTEAWRAANNDVANSVGVLIGLAEDPVRADVVAMAAGSTTSNFDNYVSVGVGIGIDSSSVNSANSLRLCRDSLSRRCPSRGTPDALSPGSERALRRLSWPWVACLRLA